MAESAPPPTPASVRKRPWYLVAALIAASVIGLNAAVAGAHWLNYYRSPRPDAALELARGETLPMAPASRAVLSGEEREAVVKALDAVLDARDAKRQRFYALAIAELLLGAAIFFVAGRAMSGRLAARNLLMQLVGARAAVAAVTFATTGDVRRAEVVLGKAEAIANLRAQGQQEALRAGEHFLDGMIETWLLLPFAFLMGASALIVIALTRPRARGYFDPAPDAAPER